MLEWGQLKLTGPLFDGPVPYVIVCAVTLVAYVVCIGVIREVSRVFGYVLPVVACLVSVLALNVPGVSEAVATNPQLFYYIPVWCGVAMAGTALIMALFVDPPHETSNSIRFMQLQQMEANAKIEKLEQQVALLAARLREKETPST